MVTERITLVFDGEWHGIHRTIPIEYPGPNGTNYELFLRVTSVTDGSGGKLKYDSSTSNGARDLKIYIPDAVDATRTVEITYRVRNGTRFFDDHDEFYWNVTGNDWPVPIDHASATVRFPMFAAGSLRAQAFTGVYGSTQRDASSKVDGAEARFETSNPLPMRGGLTIDVYIPKDILKEPSALTKFFWFIGGNPIVFLPLVTLAVMFTLWWTRDAIPIREFRLRPCTSRRPGFLPRRRARCSTTAFIRATLHRPSSIWRCAATSRSKRRRRRCCSSRTRTTFFICSSRATMGRRPGSARARDAGERVRRRDQTRLSSLKNRFYTAVPVIRAGHHGGVEEEGNLSARPGVGQRIQHWRGRCDSRCRLAFCSTWDGRIFSTPSLLLVVCVPLSAVIWWLFARVMTAKTVKGGRVHVAVLGFQEFMNRVDADRLKVMPPTTFEKFLPYAMALGVEHHWAQAFAGIVKDPPQWYVGPGGYVGGFNPIFFSSSMHSMASDMHQVFVSAPRASSSGSGFGGGGSAEAEAASPAAALAAAAAARSRLG